MTDFDEQPDDAIDGDYDMDEERVVEQDAAHGLDPAPMDPDDEESFEDDDELAEEGLGVDEGGAI